MTAALKTVPSRRQKDFMSFLRAVVGNESPYCFLAINSEPVERRNGKGTYTRNQAILLPAGASDAELMGAFDELDELNGKGYDIYFVVNRLQAEYRLTPLKIGGRVIYQHKGGDADICAINAIFADFDDEISGTFDAIMELSPTAIVETSKGKYQAYWRLDGEIPVHQFNAYQTALRARLAKYKPDESVNSPARLMRLPGFRHMKLGKCPAVEYPLSTRFESVTQSINGAITYTPEQLLMTPLNLKLAPASDRPRDVASRISPETLAQFNAGAVDEVDSGDDADFAMMEKRIAQKRVLDEDPERIIAELTSAVEYLIEHPSNPLGIDAEGDQTYGFWMSCGQALAFAKGTASEAACRELWLSTCNDPSEGEAKWQTFNPQNTSHLAIIAKAMGLGWINPLKAYSKGYRIGHDGVYKLPPPDSAKPPTLICGRLFVSALARDPNGNSMGLLLCWVDRDGNTRECALEAKRLYEDEKGVIAELADSGLYIDPAHTKSVLQYLANFNTDKRALAVRATGWQGECFVLAAGEVLKPDHITDRIVSYDASNSGASIKGTISQWQANNAKLCVGNPVLSFAVSAALAAPLLEPLGAEGFGFHYQGRSSSGKSTALMLASSVYGKGSSGADGYCGSWNGTVNAVESILARRNSLLLALDELSQANDPKTIAGTIMAIGNGAGKARLTKEATERAAKTFRSVVLSSGERTPAKELERLAKGNTASLDAGHEVRLPSIRVSEFPNAKGCFHNTQGMKPAEFAAAIKSAAVKSYGAAGRQWLEYLVAHKSNLAERVKPYIDAWLAEYTGNRELGPQQTRVARNFALVAAAGELATAVGITGWQVGAAAKDAGIMFNHYLTDRGETEVTETQQILDAVRNTLMTEFARFQSVRREDTRLVPRRLGFFESAHTDFAEQWGGDEDEHGCATEIPDADIKFYIKDPKQLEELAQGFDAQTIAKTLADAGFLELPSKGKGFQKVVSSNSNRQFAGITSRSTRFYVITGNILE